ncbi:MAG: TonB-dependent siderophore receptor, partial [Methyloglobulus sp.]|nr:TonB-dependent siderophore receptor [Methyloglobulus sp.]
NVSGVQLSTSSVDYVNFVIRGFEANASTYKNGFRQDSFAEETSNLERIEVLKGPAAMLYGRIEPGGLVNLQTAKPLSERHYSLQQQFGSYDFYRTVLDATGPITDDKSLLYRLNFAYRNNDSFRDLSFRERIFLAPSFTWNISDRTQVNLLLEYQNDDFRGDYGFGVENGKNRPVNLPISRSLSDPAAFDQQESQRIFADWSHTFNDDWKITHRFMAGFTDYEQYDIFTNPTDAGNPVYTRGLWGVHQDRDIYATNLDLTGHFNTWGAKHSVLLGFDYYRFDQKAPGYCCSLENHPLGTINGNNPVYGAVSRDAMLAFTSQNQNFFYDSLQDWKGVYFQDQITLWDKLHILGGGRYDWASFSTGYSGTSQAEASADLNRNINDKEKFSPRVGLLYRPWAWLSVYGNYTESLGSNNSNLSVGALPLAPQTAEQFEAGFKTELFNKRLTTSVAYFHIDKQNIQAFDIANSTDNRRVFRNIGEANSQGLEIDLSGQLTDNWNIIASYAYTDTEITKDTSCGAFAGPGGTCSQPGIGNTGNRLPNAALHSGSVWTTYEFDKVFGQDWLSGLSLGTGVFVVGQRQGDFENTFQLPGYVRWDASAAYKWDIGKSRLTAQLNIRNLLDKRYFSGADTIDAYQRGYGNIPGEPITFMGLVKLEY